MSTASHTHDRKAVQEFVFDEIEAIGVEADSISPDAVLETIGLDSLDVVELSQSVKKRLGIAVQPQDFADAVTVSDVLTIIAEHAGIA